MINENKINLRKKFFLRRNSISGRKIKDKKISDRLKKLINANDLKIALYHSVNNEVNLESFVRFMR